MEAAIEVMKAHKGLEEFSSSNYPCVVLFFSADPSYRELQSHFTTTIMAARCLPVRILQIDKWRC